MSDDTDRPRKTLTLSRPSRPAAEEDNPRRKRSGARAKHAAQQERDKEKTGRRQEPPRMRDETMSRGRAAPLAPAVQEFNESDDRDELSSDEDTIEFINEPVVEKRKRPLSTKQAEIFHVFAPCPQGLEQALAAEMQALGFDDAQPGRAGCSFTADWSGIQRANLYSRLATRILAQVAQEEIGHEDDILDLAYSVPWERWFGAEQTLRVDTSAIKSPVRSLQYCNLRAKDGICDRLRDREGARPDIDTVRPDARVHLFIHGTLATLYLDTSGESLFKRGWRLDKGEAPLRENLAAGLLALSGWDPAAPLLDPFCGSGTILIEAAGIALGVPAGVWRPFGFERMRGFDSRHWRDLKDDARSRIRSQLDTPLFGYDLDPQAVEYARANAERAWLTPDAIRFDVGDARTVEPPCDPGWIVTNPPYGDRMDQIEENLWRDWASNLKKHYAGWRLHAISSDMALPQQLRLKPQRRVPIHNGALDCRLFGFELVASSYREA